jgi:hypothetical protein
MSGPNAEAMPTGLSVDAMDRWTDGIPEDPPEDLGVSLDVRGLRPYVVERDGDLVLAVTDGDVEVEISPGAGGSHEQAMLGAERLATAAHEYADALRRRALS